MTAADLMEIIRSPDFRLGLEEISSYLASIMQETPIKHLLAKCLWKKKHLYALERSKRHDLTVWTPTHPSGEKETTLECKINYDRCTERLSKELNKALSALRENAPNKTTKGSKWGVMPGILKDICAKEPDIFLWIICSRDLSGVSDSDIKRIVGGEPLKKYRRTHPYKTDRDFLVVVDLLLQLLQNARPFSISAAEIETDGDFPSTYHFRVCEFQRQ